MTPRRLCREGEGGGAGLSRVPLGSLRFPWVPNGSLGFRGAGPPPPWRSLLGTRNHHFLVWSALGTLGVLPMTSADASYGLGLPFCTSRACVCRFGSDFGSEKLKMTVSASPRTSRTLRMCGFPLGKRTSGAILFFRPNSPKSAPSRPSGAQDGLSWAPFGAHRDPNLAPLGP